MAVAGASLGVAVRAALPSSVRSLRARNLPPRSIDTYSEAVTMLDGFLATTGIPLPLVS